MREIKILDLDGNEIARIAKDGVRIIEIEAIHKDTKVYLDKLYKWGFTEEDSNEERNLQTDNRK